MTMVCSVLHRATAAWGVIAPRHIRMRFTGIERQREPPRRTETTPQPAIALIWTAARVLQGGVRAVGVEQYRDGLLVRLCGAGRAFRPSLSGIYLCMGGDLKDSLRAWIWQLYGLALTSFIIAIGEHELDLVATSVSLRGCTGRRVDCSPCFPDRKKEDVEARIAGPTRTHI